MTPAFVGSNPTCPVLMFIHPAGFRSLDKHSNVDKGIKAYTLISTYNFMSSLENLIFKVFTKFQEPSGGETCKYRTLVQTGFTRRNPQWICALWCENRKFKCYSDFVNLWCRRNSIVDETKSKPRKEVEDSRCSGLYSKGMKLQRWTPPINMYL